MSAAKVFGRIDLGAQRHVLDELAAGEFKDLGN